MITIGSKVRIKEPFNVDFPNEYTIEDIIYFDDGQKVYIIENEASFDELYLESVE